MDKARISITISPDVLSELDADAGSAGMSRSAYLERVLREHHFHMQMERYRRERDARGEVGHELSPEALELRGQTMEHWRQRGAW